ncbi:MAG: four helix bundle protein [Duncaniella sp.]|jgi:four helix bundle protein
MDFSFERLTVWQKSLLLVKKIYAITNNFTDREKFGLTDQMRRAAVSISSNLAEGSGRISTKERCTSARFPMAR